LAACPFPRTQNGAHGVAVYAHHKQHGRLRCFGQKVWEGYGSAAPTVSNRHYGKSGAVWASMHRRRRLMVALTVVACSWNDKRASEKDTQIGWGSFSAS